MLTKREIKRRLAQRRRAGLRPWSLYQLAQLRGCSRSVMTLALSQPDRYRAARQF